MSPEGSTCHRPDCRDLIQWAREGGVGVGGKKVNELRGSECIQGLDVQPDEMV